MPRPSLTAQWVSLTKLSTVAMSLVAFFAPQTQANTSNRATGASIRGASSASLNTGQVMVRTDGQSLYLSEDGARYEELTLEDTAEGARLQKLLKELRVGSAPVRVPVDRLIVADGGSGAHRPKQADESTASSEKSTGGR